MSTKVRNLWVNVPQYLIPRACPPQRLSQRDLDANYDFRGSDGDERHNELILRVCAGVKPFAVMLLRTPGRTLLPEKTLLDASNHLDVNFSAFFTRKGRRVAAVYQGLATLNQFYDRDRTIARYAAEGIVLDRELFETPLSRLARHVVFEEFPETIKLPLLGLCLGYPINETIDMIRSIKSAAIVGK